MKLKLSVALAGMLLGGCLSFGNEMLLDETTVAQIKAGETTKAQVTALLGEPTYQRSTQVFGYTYEWWSYKVTTSTINPLEYILLVGFFFNGIGLPDERRDLHLSINPDGIVTGLHQQVTAYDMGGLFSPLSVTSRTKTSAGLQGQRTGPTQYEGTMQVPSLETKLVYSPKVVPARAQEP